MIQQDFSFYPKALIVPEAYNQLFAYILSCQEEISGLGKVEVKNNFLIIPQVFIVKQKCNREKTDITQGASDFLYELIKNGGDPSKIKFWWHSHGDDEVFWSKEDLKTIENWGFGNADFLLSCVFNRHYEIKARIDFFQPVRFGLDNIPLVVLNDLNPQLLKEVQKEIYEKVAYVPFKKKKKSRS